MTTGLYEHDDGIVRNRAGRPRLRSWEEVYVLSNMNGMEEFFVQHDMVSDTPD